MTTNLVQPSFAAGELSPSLLGRVDLNKYHVGAATMRNMFVDYRGGSSNRPGTQFIGIAGDPHGAVRLIPFVFSAAIGQTYILVFQNLTLTFIKNPGGPAYTNASNSGFIMSGASRYQIATPYAAADLMNLKYSQSADVMQLTCDGYLRQELKRFADTNWTLTGPTIGPTVAPPTGLTLAITAPPTGSTDPLNTTHQYVVTSVDANGQESEASVARAITGADMGTTPVSITCTWTSTGAQYYNIYKTIPGTGGATPSNGSNYGFCGYSLDTKFVDTNIIADFTRSPSHYRNPFPVAGTVGPTCSAYFQQRLVLASLIEIDGSRPGFYNNFDVSIPSQDDDAFTFDLAAQQVNAILHMVPMPGGLVLFSDGGVSQLTGGSASANNPLAVTPSSAVIVPQSYYACEGPKPTAINYDLIYWSRGKVIDLTYNFFVNIYTGTDISALSSHLFYPHEIVDWAWADTPFKVKWVVRDDGVLISLTYLKEQDIYGWARHDTQGAFTDVATVREGIEDAVYFVVTRFGQVYIERMAQRNIGAAHDSWFLDCALSTQVTANYPVATLTPMTNVPVGGTVEFATSAASGAAVGNIVDAFNGYATVTSIIDATHFLGVVRQIFPLIPNTNTPKPIAAGGWQLLPAVATFGGLPFPDGTAVMACVDGAPQGPFAVTGGAVTLTTPGANVVIGLSYQAQLQTLYMDAGGLENSVQGKRKKISAASIRVKDTAGIKVGTTFSTLTTFKPGFSSTDPVYSQLFGNAGQPLVTGDQRLTLDPNYSVTGQVCIQQDQPLPVTVLAVIPEITLGDTP